MNSYHLIRAYVYKDKIKVKTDDEKRSSRTAEQTLLKGRVQAHEAASVEYPGM